VAGKSEKVVMTTTSVYGLGKYLILLFGKANERRCFHRVM
jgi:hypothetical protein